MDAAVDRHGAKVDPGRAGVQGWGHVPACVSNSGLSGLLASHRLGGLAPELLAAQVGWEGGLAGWSASVVHHGGDGPGGHDHILGPVDACAGDAAGDAAGLAT
jgi:hypothetical protein